MLCDEYIHFSYNRWTSNSRSKFILRVCSNCFVLIHILYTLYSIYSSLIRDGLSFCIEYIYDWQSSQRDLYIIEFMQ